MLSIEPNIVFVDDKIEEVEGIVDLYRNEGVGVKYFNANLSEGDNKPETNYSNVNLLYLDLYYKDDFDVDLCLGWVDSIIPNGGFYILVIWSKDTQHFEEVISGLDRIGKKPFLAFSETKNDDYKNEDNSFKWDALKAKITSELENVPELEELAVWKRSILYSSNKIIGHLSSKVDKDALKKKLQKIVIGHGGTYLLGDNKENEKREVLFDALDNILISNSKSTRPKTKISEANKNSLYNIPDFPDSDIDSELNSWFHFNLINSPLSNELISPGLISYFDNNSLKKNYSLLNDENVSEYLTTQITPPQGTSPAPQIVEIAVIISRPCDVAQNKFGNNLKLLSGLLVVNPVRKNDKRHSLKGGSSMPISLKVYDHLSFDEEYSDCTMLFDFRYSFSLPPNIFHERFKKAKIFNKELLSEIQVEYSSYVNRLGITQII